MVGRSRSARALGGALLSFGVLLSSAACGGGSSFADTATTTSARTTTSAPTTTSTPTTTTSTSSSTSPSTSSSAATSGSPTLGPTDSGRVLTLADFFMPSSDWQEKRYDIADKSQVQGIGIKLSGCSSTPEQLELRLGNKFNQLTFSFAQANDSVASDQTVSVQVLANNTQVEIRSVPFNQIQDFSINVQGVNALKIGLKVDTNNACGSVDGVLTNITLH